MATVLMTTMMMMLESGRSHGIILWHVPQAADQSDTQGAAACLSYMSLVPDIVIIIIVITTTTFITTIIIIIITHQTSCLLLPASLTNQTASKTQQSFCLTSWSQLTTLLQSSTEYDLQNMNALGVVWVVGMTPHNGETSALMCALYVHCPVFLSFVVALKNMDGWWIFTSFVHVTLLLQCIACKTL